jgi:hypothetical protein
MNEQAKSLIAYINSTPYLVSLLYDLDLLPEQVESDSHDFRRMLIIANAFASGEVQYNER